MVLVVGVRNWVAVDPTGEMRNRKIRVIIEIIMIQLIIIIVTTMLIIILGNIIVDHNTIMLLIKTYLVVATVMISIQLLQH